MKVDIIVVYIQRYARGHEFDFVPPITGIHLAAITPPRHQVRVIHQQVETVRFDTDADLVALSFFSGFAPEAYRLAAEFRRRGKLVVAGGPHATFSPRPPRMTRFGSSPPTALPAAARSSRRTARSRRPHSCRSGRRRP